MTEVVTKYLMKVVPKRTKMTEFKLLEFENLVVLRGSIDSLDVPETDFIANQKLAVHQLTTSPVYPPERLTQQMPL